MPKFTFTKHSDFASDSVVEMTFTSDMLHEVRDHFEDFVRGAGFFPEEALLEQLEAKSQEDFEFRLLTKDHIPTPDEWMFDDSLPLSDT